jgi:hypothetical protein
MDVVYAFSSLYRKMQEQRARKEHEALFVQTALVLTYL